MELVARSRPLFPQVLYDVPSDREARQNPLLDEFFTDFDSSRGRFVPTAQLRSQYPPPPATDRGSAELIAATAAAAAADGTESERTAASGQVPERAPAGHSGDDEVA